MFNLKKVNIKEKIANSQFYSRVEFKNNNKRAFTLAEVLITIGIIGIIAVILVETVKSVTDRVYETRRTQVETKLGDVMKTLNAKDELEEFSSTEEFANFLSAHLKIIKKCDVSKLKECFPEKIKYSVNSENDDEMEALDTTGLKKGVDLGQLDNNTDNVGIVLADGTSLILTYDLNCKTDPYSNESSVSKCLKVIYDTNGFGKPNTISKDVGFFNASIGGIASGGRDCLEIDGFCADLTDTVYGPVSSEYGEIDYYTGAKKACEAQGKRLPTLTEGAMMQRVYASDLGMKSPYIIDRSGTTCATNRLPLVMPTNGTLQGGNSITVGSFPLRCVK